MEQVRRKITEDYLRLVDLETQVIKCATGCLSFPLFSNLSEKQWERANAFHTEKTKLKISTGDASKKMYEIMPSSCKALIQDRKNRAKRMDKIRSKNISVEEKRDQAFKVFRHDPFFQWIREHNKMHLGTMGRALCDGASYLTDIYHIPDDK